MAQEKGFCELLSLAIIDEKKAVPMYYRLLELLKEEEDVLFPKAGRPEKLEESRQFLLNLITRDIEDIVSQEMKHQDTVEELGKSLCGFKILRP